MNEMCVSVACIKLSDTAGYRWLIIKQIFTSLPCSDEAFEQGLQTSEMSLAQALGSTNAKDLSPFAGVVVVTSIFGQALTHLHRPDAEDHEENIDGPFWKRHRNLDGRLLNMFLFLPYHLRLPMAQPTSNTVFLNMCLHAATICLHQIAIFKAEKYGLHSVLEESQMRCMTAAGEINAIMRSIVHVDLTPVSDPLSFMHPLTQSR